MPLLNTIMQKITEVREILTEIKVREILTEIKGG